MEVSLKSIIGSQVRTARKAKDWSQNELATRIDRSVEAISNIERGVSLPTLDTLERIANSTDTEIVRFFTPSEFHDPVHSRSRSAKMLRLKAACDRLSERDLSIAIDQIEAFVKAR